MASATVKDLAQWFEVEVSRASNAAFRTLMIPGEAYLYFRAGRIEVAHEAPDGMELATPERVPCNKDRAGLRAWIMARVRSVACLPVYPE